MACRLGTSKFLRSINCSSDGKFSIDDSFVVAFEFDSPVIKAVAGVVWALDFMNSGGFWSESDVIAGGVIYIPLS